MWQRTIAVTMDTYAQVSSESTRAVLYDAEVTGARHPENQETAG